MQDLSLYLDFTHAKAVHLTRFLNLNRKVRRHFRRHQSSRPSEKYSLPVRSANRSTWFHRGHEETLQQGLSA